MKWYELLKPWGGKKAGEKVQLSDEDAKSLVDTGFAKAVETDPAEEAAKKAVDEAIDGLRKGVSQVVHDELLTALKSIKFDGKTPNIEVGKNLEDENPLSIRKNLGAFGKAVKAANRGQISESLKRYMSEIDDVSQKLDAANETTGEDGGILVPEELSARLFERAIDNPLSLLSRVDGMTIGSNSMSMNGLVDDDRSSLQRNGGIISYWVDEGSQLQSSKLKFRKINWMVHKLAILAFVTDEQLEDSLTALDQFLTRKAGDELEFVTTEVILAGDGNAKPQGMIGSACRIVVAKESGQTAGTVLAMNISKMWANMPTASRMNAAWLINPELEPALDYLAMPVQTTTSGAASLLPVYMPPGGLADAPLGRIKGRPVIPSEHCSAPGTIGDIALIDPMQYGAVTKGTVKSAMSMHLRFDYDEMAFRFTYRMDGRMYWEKSRKPFKGSVNFRQSPVVLLDSTS